MAWRYLGGLRKLVLKRSDTNEIIPYSPFQCCPLFADELSTLIANPWTYRLLNKTPNSITQPDLYAECVNMGPGSLNLGLFDSMPRNAYLSLYNPDVGENISIRFIHGTATSGWTCKANLYGNLYNMGFRGSYEVAPSDCYLRPWVSLGLFIDDDNGQTAYFSVNCYASYRVNQSVADYNYYRRVLSADVGSSNRPFVQAVLYSLITGNEAPVPSGEGPYDDGGLSGPGGGDPDEQNFDEESDVISEPQAPVFSATGSGMVTAYVPTLSEMNDIADYLIDPNIIQVLAGSVLKLSDVIIGLNLFPFSVPASQSKVVSLNLMGARLGTGISCHYADRQFVTLDMGSIQIVKCWDNCLDFNPYTRISIFLPFCGYYELDTDEVMGRTINVKYKIDIMTGSCVALVIVDGSVLYQFAGQCASQIPISSVSFDGMISSMIDLGMTVASAQAAVAGAAAAAEDAEEAFFAARDAGVSAKQLGRVGSKMANTADNLVSVKGNAGRQLMGATANAILSSKGFYSHAGGLSSAPGFLGVRKPFIIKKIPKQSIPTGYGKLRGYPSNITSKLGDLSGYTEVEEIQLNIPNATVAEISECERILKAGCYL